MIAVPVVALVGRPNVGKSTLFNRMVGKRSSLVINEPGATRDRLFGDATIDGRLLRVVDTGGLEANPNDVLYDRMRAQTTMAIEEADMVIVIFDGADGLQPADEEVVHLLRRAGKPVLGVVNKIDVPDHEDRLIDFYALGLENIIAVSAEHGRGIDELHECILHVVAAPLAEETQASLGPLPVQEDDPQNETASRIEWQGGSIRVAVIGRPNVGKSSLVNMLLGENRLITTDIAGTTRDPVDTTLTQNGQEYVFVDTAGMRRQRSISDKIERFSVMAAMRSIDKADVALMLLDASARPSEQDARIASAVHGRGKGIVLVANKWDLLENIEWIEGFPKAVALDLATVSYAPLVRVSAKTSRGVNKIFTSILEVQKERHRRIGTGELNRFFEAVIGRSPPTHYKGKRPHLYYVSQPMVRPPTFVFTCRNPHHISNAYARYLRNQLREHYGFAGTPLWLKFRPRGKQKERTGGKRLDK